MHIKKPRSTASKFHQLGITHRSQGNTLYAPFTSKRSRNTKQPASEKAGLARSITVHGSIAKQYI